MTNYIDTLLCYYYPYPSGGHLRCLSVRAPGHVVCVPEAAQLPLAGHPEGAATVFRHHATGPDPVAVLWRRGHVRLETAALYSKCPDDLVQGNVLLEEDPSRNSLN